MLNEWRPSSWGDEVTLEYGKAIRGYSRTHGTYRVFGSNGPIGWTSDALTEGPGVVLGRKGAYRGVEFCREPFWVIDTAYYLVPKTDLDMRWLYYAAKHYKLGETDDGSPIPSTTRAAVYMLELEVPPKNDQLAIAHILGTLDDRIELNRKMTRSRDPWGTAIFKCWWVALAPVRANAEGRDPGLPPHIANLFPNTFQDSELGEIPEGWGVAPVGKTCDSIFSGGTPNTQVEAFWGGSTPWFSSGETRNPFVIETEKSITQAGVIGSSTRQAEVGCTVIAGAGQGRTRGQTSLLGLDAYINQSVVALKANSSASSSLFLFFDMSRRYQEFRRISDSHSSRGSLTTKLISSLKVVVPKMFIIREFDKIAEPLVRRIYKNLFETKTLTSIRGTLLPKLLSGAIEIPTNEILAMRAR